MTRKLITITLTAFALAGVVGLSRKGAEARRTARNRALAQAVSDGDLDQAATLLQAGADVRTRTPQGESLLFAADGTHNPVLLGALVQRGLSLRERDAKGSTVLHRAALRGDLEMLEALIELGQPVNELDARGRSALNLALRGARFEAAHLLLTHGADARSATKEPPLVSLLSAEFLSASPTALAGRPGSGSISSGFPGTFTSPQPNSDPSSNFLRRPAASGRDYARSIACVRELLSCGADPNAHDVEGRSVVDVALSRGCWTIARLLVKKMGGWRDSKGRTALRIAADLGSREGVAEFYPVPDRPNEGAETELLLATWIGDHQRVSTLLASGLGANRAGVPGKTPLGRAAEQGDIGLLKLLLSHYARPEQPEAGGKTPLHLAAEHLHLAAARALLAAGAPLEARSASGRTPLHEAAGTPFASRTAAAPKQSSRQAVVQLLLQRGANVNARDNWGTTPLQAALNSFPEPDRSVALLLIEHGSSVSGGGKLEGSLFAAVRTGDTALAAALLARGAEINERAPNDGATPLWRAAMGDQLEMLRFLHSRGARLPERFISGGPTRHTDRVADVVQAWRPTDERRKLLLSLFPELQAEAPTAGVEGPR